MCLHKRNYWNLFILITIVFYTTLYSVQATPPNENKVSKIVPDSSRYFFERGKSNEQIGARIMTQTAGTQKNRTTANISVTESSHVKKWQVGRVSRRQYEIINMLWRKTKEFGDVDTSTTSYHSLYTQASRLSPTLSMSTPSFIEFYYLEENDERIKDSSRKRQLFKEPHVKYTNNFIGDYPIFALHINNRKNEHLMNRDVNAYTKSTHKTETPLSGFLKFVTFQKISKGGLNKRSPANKVQMAARHNVINKDNLITAPFYTVDNETCPDTTQYWAKFNKEMTKNNFNGNKAGVIHRNLPKSSTEYDRIKFFEIYDKHTPLPFYKEEGKRIDLDDIEKVINGNKLNTDQKILLKHVDQSIGNEHSRRSKQSHAKKHIVENNKSYSKDFIKENIILKPTQAFNISPEKENNIKNVLLNESLSSKSKVPKMPENIINKVAVWSDYSFMAVYIYEPSQVHCDAAGISPHWLVTSGSCLSRHHKNPSGDGRSAFVTYCSSSWWTAERIAYVKYSVVHPYYQQKDSKRRYMYNIGLIQVVISLTTCPGWAPISLMSHRFVTDTEGSSAYAIGWGLDRYNTQYTSADLPKYPLMMFESRVFSDSCPDSISYM